MYQNGFTCRSLTSDSLRDLQFVACCLFRPFFLTWDVIDVIMDVIMDVIIDVIIMESIINVIMDSIIVVNMINIIIINSKAE